MRSLIIPALVLAFTVYCVIDVVRSEDSAVRGLPKMLWVLLVLLFPLAGGAAWFIAGRPRGTKPPGADRLSRPRPRVLGPDDDPDFLRTIDRPSPVDPAGPIEATEAGPTGAGPASPGPTAAGPTGSGAADGPGEEANGRGTVDPDEPSGQDDRRS